MKMAWTSPKTWTADELLTASDLNQYISDNLSALYALVQGGGRKNLLHNGAMQVHQRGTSVTGTTSGGILTADRWNMAFNGSLGTWTQSVENDAPTGSGFRKSYKALITAGSDSDLTGADVADYVRVRQAIEGQNLQAVLKGTANAQPLTLSFWTKSNKTGTYVVWLYDVDNARHVSATYTVAASATWEQQTITFPADLTGAFDNDENSSMQLVFWLAAGTDYTSGTLATAWAAAVNANTAVGQTNLAASTNNYWQVTGVQLEVGSAATGFEHKDYGTELSECQRYYYRHATGAEFLGYGFYQGAGEFDFGVQFPTTMRIAPAIDTVSGTDYYYCFRNGSFDAFDTLNSLAHTSTKGTTVSCTTGVSGNQDSPGGALGNNALAYLGFSADL